ncbi:hypothetical protein E2C01_085231 [Portunus trituberculatus]|uniref:Uncharacterized protein n=1 Tax=Portunus trituberculatus TaxID=210409 RepID=A0A5B7J695_PORTR|nr:hypothetical protein [Portunus trituberculatus]
MPWPPSLAHLGDLRSGSKAELVISLTTHASRPPLPAAVQLFETPVDDNPALFHDLSDVPSEISDDTASMIVVDPSDNTADVLDDAVLVPVCVCTPEVDAKVLDGAAIVQMLSPKLAKTFQEYVDLIFLPYIQRQFETATRATKLCAVHAKPKILCNPAHTKKQIPV